MWRTESEAIDAGMKYRVFDDEQSLSVAALLRLLRGDRDFSAWYTELLAGSNLIAFYWELPPVTLNNLDDPAEFVLLNAPALAGSQAQPAPFEPRFAADPDADVLVFPNLGGDATLVVPRPLTAPAVYAHFAVFLRQAPAAQIQAFWQYVAAALEGQLADSPVWLSTAGLGVAWLHVRIDTRPKYYSYTPYTQFPYVTTAGG